MIIPRFVNICQRCAAVSHTPVRCTAQCKETKTDMNPVLESTATQMAQPESLNCNDSMVAVTQTIRQDFARLD